MINTPEVTNIHSGRTDLQNSFTLEPGLQTCCLSMASSSDPTTFLLGSTQQGTGSQLSQEIFFLTVDVHLLGLPEQKYHRLGRLKQQKCIPSLSWRLGVYHQDGGRFGFPWDPSPQLADGHFVVFSHSLCPVWVVWVLITSSSRTPVTVDWRPS